MCEPVKRNENVENKQLPSEGTDWIMVGGEERRTCTDNLVVGKLRHRLLNQTMHKWQIVSFQTGWNNMPGPGSTYVNAQSISDTLFEFSSILCENSWEFSKIFLGISGKFSKIEEHCECGAVYEISEIEEHAIKIEYRLRCPCSYSEINFKIFSWWVAVSISSFNSSARIWLGYWKPAQKFSLLQKY